MQLEMEALQEYSISASFLYGFGMDVVVIVDANLCLQTREI